VYAGLAFAPPFNLFRVPARWLALFAFGVALLAGLGLDTWGRSTGRMRLWASLAALLPLALVPLAIGRN
ncbi:MAG TPA: hypothetical protein PLC98_20300, partial [Anaerolineales bacterium]|nr:hypothetical protein [Anaerolineales bacterium]